VRARLARPALVAAALLSGDGLADRLAAEPAVAWVREALGKEKGAWIVGGTIRDALLGRPVLDVDLAVAGEPEPVARRVAASHGGTAFALSEAFGSWRALDRRRGFVCDVSRLRGDGIEADLHARDFSINAMGSPLDGGALLDPTGGRGDLEQRRLRVLPGAYAEDRLRPLRLVRLAAELGFSPDEATAGETRAAAERVIDASPERIFAELRRTVSAPGVLEGLELAGELGLLSVVLPELEVLGGIVQGPYHHLDVLGHSVEALKRLLELERTLDEVFGDSAPALRAILAEPLGDELTRGQALRLGTLLHDIGKAQTAAARDGRIIFPGHDRLGEEMVRALCRRLRTSERLAGFLGALARHHLVLGFLVPERPLDRRGVFRYLEKTSPVELEVTLLSCADRMATRGRKAEPAIAAHLELAAQLMADAVAWRREGPPAPLVRGGELARELDLTPGPALGQLLARLAEARFAGEIATRDDALALARRLEPDSR